MTWRDGYNRYGTLNGVAPNGIRDCWGRPRGNPSSQPSPLEGVAELIKMECLLTNVTYNPLNMMSVFRRLREEGLTDATLPLMLEERRARLEAAKKDGKIM